MNTLRLRFENGHLIPLEPLPNLQNGDEIVVSLIPQIAAADLDDMLNRTRGLWADWDDVEELIDDSRKKWDQAWRDNLSSS